MIIKSGENKIEGEKIRVYKKEDNQVIAKSDSDEEVVSVDKTVPTKKHNGDYPLIFEEKDGYVEVFVKDIDENISVGNNSTSYGVLKVQSGDRVEIGSITDLVVNF